jgi:hypothetical protein
MTNDHITSPEISREALALLGGGRVAYVKAIRSEDVQKQFPQPIMLTDSRESAIANAWSQELETVGLH